MPSDDDFVTIDHFFSVADAELARSALEASEIDAIVDALIHGGVRLQVRRSDAPLALAILTGEHLRAEEMERPSERSYLPARAAVCRRCGSEEIYRVQDRGRLFAQALVFVIAATALIPLADWVVTLAGVRVPHDFFRIAFAAAIGVPLIAAIVAMTSRKMRCRNCGLET